MSNFEQYATLRQKSRLFRDGFRRRTAEIASCLKRAFPSGGFRLLDIGTADGMMLEILRRGFPQSLLVGLEAHPNLVTVARRRGHNVVLGRAEALPFADASFDVLTLVSTLKHIPQYHATLSECLRTLVPGGQVIVSDPTPFGIRLGLRRGHFERLYLPNIWSVELARSRLIEAGFEIIAAYRYMPLPLDFYGSKYVETLGRSMGLSSLFMQQVVHARSKSP